MGILLTKEEITQNGFRISTCPDPERVFTTEDGSYSKNFLFGFCQSCESSEG